MMDTIVLKITGMHCTSCARLIELSLKDLDGVESVEVDYESGEASIRFDPERQSTDALVKAVSEAGYGAVEDRS